MGPGERERVDERTPPKVGLYEEICGMERMDRVENPAKWT